MKVIEVTSTDYPNAHELPNRGGRPTNGTNKSSSGNSAGKKASHIVPGANSSTLNAIRKRDQEITEECKMVMWLVNGKHRFMRMSDYKAGILP